MTVFRFKIEIRIDIKKGIDISGPVPSTVFVILGFLLMETFVTLILECKYQDFEINNVIPF